LDECHLGLIADALKVAHWRMIHLRPGFDPVEHRFTHAANVNAGSLSYRVTREEQAIFE